MTDDVDKFIKILDVHQVSFYNKKKLYRFSQNDPYLIEHTHIYLNTY